jgi:hypothetical protein
MNSAAAAMPQTQAGRRRKPMRLRSTGMGSGVGIGVGIGAGIEAGTFCKSVWKSPRTASSKRHTEHSARCERSLSASPPDKLPSASLSNNSSG